MGQSRRTMSLADRSACEGATLQVERQEAEKGGTGCILCLQANCSHFGRLSDEIIEMLECDPL